MRRKTKYCKAVQLNFRTRKEYDTFHTNAVNFFGEGRAADCTYLRECIKQNTKRRKKSTREKARALVESTQQLNELSLTTNNPYMQDEISDILRRQVKLWEF